MRFPFLSFPRFLLLLLFLTGAKVVSAAPADTARTVIVSIISARNSYGLQTDSGLMQRMIDSVQLRQGDTYMSCDSAYLNLVTNNMEAFGNVRITQPGGTQVTSDYLRYTGNKKLAYLRGNVSLTDGKNNLWSEDLTYDVASKTGTYDNGGTLQSDATTLSSNTGMYNTRSKDARFKGEVYVSDPEYTVTSDDLGYNTNTKVVRFFGPSVVINDKSELHTSSGWYDSKRELAHFTSRSSIRSGSQYIEANTIDYNRVSGYGKATGKVIAIDTEQHATLWSGYAVYNELSKTLFATVKPVLRNEHDKDSIFIASDTFYSAPKYLLARGRNLFGEPSPRPSDTKSLKISRRSKSSPIADSVASTAFRASDTSGIKNPRDTMRAYIGYHHVRIWSDSLQGSCDSIAYLASDSLLKMMGKPVAWSRASQITGDTLLLYTDSNRIRRLFVPGNALVVSRSGPEKAKMFDQVQGKTLNAFFKNGQLDYMVVFPAAENIYYPKDDDGAYLGVTQVESERMKVFFKDAKIHRIIFEQEIKQKMTPLDKAVISTMRLSRFQWLEEKRPKSKAELFE